MTRRAVYLALILVFWMVASVSSADGATILRTFTNPNPQSQDQFGLAVASVGANVAVSAPLHSPGGVVYLFDAASGTVVHTLQGTSPPFGRQIAAVGTDVLVASGMNGSVVHLFDGTTGDLRHAFFDPTPGDDSWFGWSVAAFGSDVLIADVDGTTGGPDTGAVHLFDATTGTLIRSFANPNSEDLGARDAFGFGIAALGSYVIVGAPYNDAAGPDAGAVYFFDRATGDLVDTLLNPQPATRSFGSSLAAGNRLLVAAPWEATGRVFVFDPISRGLLHELSDPIGGFSLFGWSVAEAGDRVLVGAPWRTVDAQDQAGVVYVFSADDGTLLDTLHKSAPASSDWLGYSVAALGEDVLVGAIWDDSTPTPTTTSTTGTSTTSSTSSTVEGASTTSTTSTSSTSSSSTSIAALSARIDMAVMTGGQSDTGAVYLFSASPVTLAEHPRNAARLVVKGERIVWVSTLPALGLPASEPALTGATFRIVNPTSGETGVASVPTVGWTNNRPGTLRKFTNRLAPLGPSPVRSILLKQGSLLKVVVKDSLISLDEATQGTLDVELVVGNDRYCGRCSAAVADEPGRYVARRCAPPAACP